MKIDDIKSLLAKADTALEQVSVSGPSVYAMVEARTALKKAFDELNKSEN